MLQYGWIGESGEEDGFLYSYSWDNVTGGYLLQPETSTPRLEVRPVFFEELDLLKLHEFWEYERSEAPLLFAQGRQYFYRGNLVAEVKGGRLYTFPQVEVYERNLRLEPVNLEAMLTRNHHLLDGLVKETLEKIYTVFQKYKKKSYFFYVAFSGGKDSLVLLDLVQRVLPPDEFVVIFADTTMELSETYHTFQQAQKRWPTLQFYVARSTYDARESWKIFGPPSRVLRWCCSVHKSAPSLLLLRKLAGKLSLRALAFDGIRAEESLARATYALLNEGEKHLIQVNCSPLLSWESSEVYLYLFARDIFLNRCYRYGMSRVGCIMCPYGSQWREFVTSFVFREEVTPFVDILSEAFQSSIPEGEMMSYIIQGKWKERSGGKTLNDLGNKVIEVAKGNGSILLQTREKHPHWREWAKTLGFYTVQNHSFIRWNGESYPLRIQENEQSLTVEISLPTQEDQKKKLLRLVKSFVNKVAYCKQCKACVVECPTGALEMEGGHLRVNEDRCTRCGGCLKVREGCLRAHSLSVTKGVKGAMEKIRGYQTFGLRREWLHHFFKLGDAFWGSGLLGNRQFEACKALFREAELTTSKNSITELATRLKRLGANDNRTWAVILVNLAHNSGLIRWYLFATHAEQEYSSEEILEMMGEAYPLSTRQNARTSLYETLKLSPLGEEIGLGECRFKGKTVVAVRRRQWRNPDPQVILYSLYKFAEETGTYSFTLSQLLSDHPERKGLSPAKIFGLEEDMVRSLLQGLSFAHSDYIHVAFTKDLDNIHLNREKNRLEVIDLF